ncbi:hypothetical protein ACK3TF_003000 [Chlorella vulgaris]
MTDTLNVANGQPVVAGAVGPSSEIIKVNGLFKVIFRHSNQEMHTLGLYATLDESLRVCDVLTSTKSTTTRQPRSAPSPSARWCWTFTTARYSHWYRWQAVPYRPAAGLLLLAATHGASSQRNGAAARNPSAVGPQGGPSWLPPRPAGTCHGGGQMSIGGRTDPPTFSPARAAFHQAGAANEAATTAAEGGPMTAAAAGRLHPPPPPFDFAPPPPAPAAAQLAQQQEAADAATAAAAAGDVDARMCDKGEAEQEQGAAGAGAGGAAGGGRGGGKRLRGQRAGGGGKRRKEGNSPEAAARQWHSADVMAFTAANHPFHGISSSKAQLTLKLDSNNRPSPKGRTSKKAHLAACGSAAEAAVSWDLAAMWKAIQYGEDPADLEVEAGTRHLNFSFERYAATLPNLRTCSSFPELQELVKSLRDEGGLARLATAGSAGAEGNGTAAGVTAAEEDEEEEEEAEEEEEEEQEEQEEEEEAEEQRAPAAAEGAAGGTSARQQPLGGGTGRGRGVGLTGAKGRSSLAGVYGKGPWVAQASVWRSKVQASQQRLWDDNRKERNIQVTGCTSSELAGACSDLLRLWRCNLYGQDVAIAPLNFPLQRYAPLLPSLYTKLLTEVGSHIAALRNAGSLQAVVEPAEKPAAAAAALIALSPAPAPPPHRQAVAVAPAVAAAAAARSAPSPATAGSPMTGRQAAAVSAAAAAPAAPAAPPLAAAPAPAAGSSDPSPTALLQRLRAMSATELQQASYHSEELQRVALQQAMYGAVEAAVEALQPDISAVQAADYMGRFLLQYDMRSLLYRKVVDWQEAGNRALLLQHVRSLLAADVQG